MVGRSHPAQERPPSLELSHEIPGPRPWPSLREHGWTPIRFPAGAMRIGSDLWDSPGPRPEWGGL